MSRGSYGGKYLRYLVPWAMQTVSIIGFAAGGFWMWTGFVLGFLIVIGGDAVLGDDLSEPTYSHAWLLDLVLYSMLPLMLVALVFFAWMCAQTGDWLGLGGWIQGQAHRPAALL